MKIDKTRATGIHVIGNDYEYIKAIRKPNVQTKIISEVFFKGKWKKKK